MIRVLEAEARFDIATLAYVAGHSLGEYSAHAAAGTFSVPDAVRLVKRRGQAMQKKAVLVGGSAMAAVGARYRRRARGRRGHGGYGTCVVANDNSQDRSSSAVIAPRSSARWSLPPKRGARRSIMLPVSAPFHCPLMAPAAELMEEALGEVVLSCRGSR